MSIIECLVISPDEYEKSRETLDNMYKFIEQELEIDGTDENDEKDLYYIIYKDKKDIIRGTCRLSIEKDDKDGKNYAKMDNLIVKETFNVDYILPDKKQAIEIIFKTLKDLAIDKKIELFCTACYDGMLELYSVFFNITHQKRKENGINYIAFSTD